MLAKFFILLFTTFIGSHEMRFAYDGTYIDSGIYIYNKSVKFICSCKHREYRKKLGVFGVFAYLISPYIYLKKRAIYQYSRGLAKGNL